MSSNQLPWSAERRLSPAEVAKLARKALDLPCNTVEMLGEGWDYINFLADEQWVLRFPKRANCDTVLVREKSILDRLNGADLAVAIPDIEHLAGPREDFPWHFAAYRYIPGTPLNKVTDDASVKNLPESIGQFLATLHTVSTDVELTDPWDFGDHGDWKRREFEAAIAAYPTHLHKPMKQFLARPGPVEPELPRVLIHADMNAEHILVDPSTGDLTGVIDWADAHTSIRSHDFVGLYYLGGRDYASRVYEAYGSEPNEDEWRWLEYAAISMCIGQIFYGVKGSKPLIAEQGLRKIETFIG